MIFFYETPLSMIDGIKILLSAPAIKGFAATDLSVQSDEQPWLSHTASTYITQTKRKGKIAVPTTVPRGRHAIRRQKGDPKKSPENQREEVACIVAYTYKNKNNQRSCVDYCGVIARCVHGI